MTHGRDSYAEAVKRTYSAMIGPLRAFLGPGPGREAAVRILHVEVSPQLTLEGWERDGRKMIFAIDEQGLWRPFVSLSESIGSAAQLTELERVLSAPAADRQALADFGALCRAFLDFLEQMPVCCDPLCSQAPCEENRKLRHAVLRQLGRQQNPTTQPTGGAHG